MVSDLTTSAAATAFARRQQPGRALAGDAGPLARACYAMALRFHRGGRLVVFGNGAASTDAQHVVVEFVHPVIVGKRALPAFSLTNDVASLTEIGRTRGFDDVFAEQLRLLGAPADIALGISVDGGCRNVARALELAHELGMLTVALVGAGPQREPDNQPAVDLAAHPSVDHTLLARSDDPRVVKEIQVTAYHVLWELVHVFFEQPGLLEPAVL